jgi:transcriptional regulator with XRE-family HTH domain
MAGSQNGGAASHFGRQMRKERLARGWPIAELAQAMGVDAAHLGRVENGKRPPTERLAAACDRVFPDRRGWFSEYYDESRTWAEVPPGFRSWAEVEEKASALRDWYPGILTGLIQTEDYAGALLATSPGASAEMITARLASRMERQRRVLTRDNPPSVWFIIDELSLYREVGSAEVMAGQMYRLAQVAAMPNVTLTVMPAVAHPANASGFIVADDSAWCEHLAGGFVYTDQETVTYLALRFDSLRAESYRASESTAIIERLGAQWDSGARRLTLTLTAANA